MADPKRLGKRGAYRFGELRVEAGGEQHSPPEISAMILNKLKEAA